MPANIPTPAAKDVPPARAKKYADLFRRLARNGTVLTPAQWDWIVAKVDDDLTYQPSIGVLGKTGAGKTRLCNAMFGYDAFEVSDVEACTRVIQDGVVGVGERGLRLVDVPGVCESEERDREYIPLYKELLPKLDIVLWVIDGATRDYGPDVTFLKQHVRPQLKDANRLFLVVTKIDSMQDGGVKLDDNDLPPGDQPSGRALALFDRKRKAVAATFGLSESKVILVSAHRQVNLVQLVDEIVHVLPREQCLPFVRGVQDGVRTEDMEDYAFQKFADHVAHLVGQAIKGAAARVGGVVSTVSGWVRGLLG